MSTSYSFPQVSKLVATLIEQGVTSDLLQDRLIGEGIMADVARALVAGKIPARDEFRQLLDLPRPLPFEKNQHGHYLIRVVGLDLSGTKEIERGTERGTRFGDWARQCFLSDRPDSYDAKHRLEQGKAYTLAVVPGKEVQGKRRTVDIQAYAKRFAYTKPLGGHIVRTRELVTDYQMQAMGFEYITGLHDPITDSDGCPSVLGASRDDGGSWLAADWDSPDGEWYGVGAFAFVVPASLFILSFFVRGEFSFTVVLASLRT